MALAAVIAQSIAALAIVIAMVQLAREIRTRNFQALYYLHKYLSQDHLSRARHRLRTELLDKRLADWTDEDREAANRVCASYDQAGFLISERVLPRGTKSAFLRSSWGDSICDQHDILRDYLHSRLTPTLTGQAFFRHFQYLYREACRVQVSTPRVVCVVSGGQTGADRAAVDFAIANSVSYRGWVPHGGWAEDFRQPPGLLQQFPAFRETDSTDSNVRTEWNVHDSDATLILAIAGSGAVSPGTEWTRRCAKQCSKPLGEVDPTSSSAREQLRDFLAQLGSGLALNIAGPRETECPGLYEACRRLLDTNSDLFLLGVRQSRGDVTDFARALPEHFT